MIPHKVNAIIRKDGHLEVRNLPFREGTKIELAIVRKERKSNLSRLISNDHVWTREDIKAVEKGRDIINQWKIF